MNVLRQTLAVTGASLRGLPARGVASLVVVLGLAGVVSVMVALLAMAEGFDRLFADAGRADRVVVLRNGDDSGTGSAIPRELAPLMVDSPGLKRDAAGQPLASIEKYIVSMLPDKQTGEDVFMVIRGVGAPVLQVRPEVHLIEGRMFQPGLREVIVGVRAREQFAGLELGREVQITDAVWTVVGVFESGGSVHETEVWGDVESVVSAYSITKQYASITAVLASEDSFDTYKDALTTNPALNHYPKRETEYYAAQSAQLSGMMRAFGYFVAGIMGLGALFSAVNTLYAAVRARTREIATLRALGFAGTPIVLSVLLEALVLCLAGGALGGALAWLFFNGYSVSTLQGGGAPSQVAFSFHVSARVLQQGLLAAGLVGLLGALLPALRAARVPVVDALRAN